MSWTPLQALLAAPADDRPLTLDPPLSRAELQVRALALAGGLQARGIRNLAVHLEDATELAVALLGAWRAGARVVLLADLQPATRERLAAEVDLWLTDDDVPLASLMAEPLPRAELNLEHEGLLIATSGSSGQSKLIGKRLYQLANELEILEQRWGARLGEALIVGSVSTQHIYGLLFRLLWPLCAGRPLAPRALPFAEDIQQASLAAGARGFAWVASPALLKRMGDNLDWPALSAVRKVFSSGGPLPAEAGAALHQRLGQYPVEVYGSSETGGIAWRQGGTAWTPLPGVEIGQNGEGALRVASPWLADGASEQTADAVNLLEDGRFVLQGRLDRIVKLEEKRISLPMLETALAEHPFVSEARLGVVQENRASLGALVALSAEGLHALRNGGRRALTDTLRQHLARHCEALALPRRWRLLLQLPVNAQGKLPQAEVDAVLAAPRPKTPARLAQQAEDGQWALDLQIPADLAYFTGHFPQTPVLPGVVQVDWAMQLARELMPLPAHYRGMEVLKFQQLIRPGDRIRLTLRFDAERGKLHFAFSQDDKPCSSGRILLGDMP